MREYTPSFVRASAGLLSGLLSIYTIYAIPPNNPFLIGKTILIDQNHHHKCNILLDHRIDYMIPLEGQQTNTVYSSVRIQLSRKPNNRYLFFQPARSDCIVVVQEPRYASEEGRFCSSLAGAPRRQPGWEEG